MIFSECWLVGSSQWSVGFVQLTFSPWLKLLLTQLCLLSAQTSQSTINVIFLLSGLNSYRLVILFIAFIHIVCYLKLYLPETT